MNFQKLVKEVPDEVGSIIQDNLYLKKWGPLKKQRTDNELEIPDDLSGLLARIDQKLDTQKVLLMCQSGSAMYGLNTTVSDVDYFVVYVDDTRSTLRLGTRSKLFFSFQAEYNVDKSGEVEVSGLELSKYVDNLLKGNPKYLEPVFSNDESIHYKSDLFSLTESYRQSFITERTVTQYLGFAKDRVREIHKTDSELKQRKCAYHGFHKVFEGRRVMNGEHPHVQVGEEERNFILSLRGDKVGFFVGLKDNGKRLDRIDIWT